MPVPGVRLWEAGRLLVPGVDAPPGVFACRPYLSDCWMRAARPAGTTGSAASDSAASSSLEASSPGVEPPRGLGAPGGPGGTGVLIPAEVPPALPLKVGRRAPKPMGLSKLRMLLVVPGRPASLSKLEVPKLASPPLLSLASSSSASLPEEAVAVAGRTCFLSPGTPGPACAPPASIAVGMEIPKPRPLGARFTPPPLGMPLAFPLALTSREEALEARACDAAAPASASAAALIPEASALLAPSEPAPLTDNFRLDTGLGELTAKSVRGEPGSDWSTTSTAGASIVAAIRTTLACSS